MAGLPAPSTARMIDYWLGGGHHHPADIAAADAFEAAYGKPCAPIFRSLREFLGRAVRYIDQRGISAYLVLGAGIPTRGNVHEVVPAARVLYTDIDPDTVALGQQILAGTTRTTYALLDATDIGAIDQDMVVGALPAWGREPVGVVFLGLAAFLSDVQLAKALDDLYEAVTPGSCLAFDFDSQELAGHPEALAMMGPGFRMRDPSSFPPLLGRWRVTAEGIEPVDRWGRTREQSDLPDAFYGGVAVK
jgi:O-methyltransferase involved in polyketide biosynthesis